jgi:hypothetical protein
MRPVLTVAFAALFAVSARADLNQWLTAVGQGTPGAFVRHSVTVPSLVNIGPINSTTGATYEFLVNGTLDGASSALMGTRNTGVASNGALKWEQHNNTGAYGVTHGGVADWSMGLTIVNTDVHLCFVVDFAANTTTLYEDGAQVGSTPWAIHLAEDVGLGEWYNATGPSVDPFVGTIYGVAVYDQALPAVEIMSHAMAFHSAIGIGGTFCAGAVANSTGTQGVIDAVGSANAGDNLLTLTVSELPTNEFAVCLVSDVQGFIPNFGGSHGHLCLSPSFGYFASQVQNTGTTGFFSIAVDLTALPFATPVSVSPGETWYFQTWHRDHDPISMSNLTLGYYIQFQ